MMTPHGRRDFGQSGAPTGARGTSTYWGYFIGITRLAGREQRATEHGAEGVAVRLAGALEASGVGANNAQ